MPPIRRTLLAVLGLATLAATGAQARSHHFKVPERHVHANSPYGHVQNYQAAMDEHDPRYVTATQKCETKGAMGALAGTDKGGHVKFFSECMVEEGAWQTRYAHDVGGKLNQ